MIKNQKGFTALESVVMVIALVAIGAAAYFAYQAHHTKTSTQPSPVGKSAPVANAPTATDPYAGWATYTSTTVKASFKYPADWKRAASEESNIPGADSVAFQSPDGATKVTWISEVDGLGGACDDTIPPSTSGGCPLVHFISATSVKAVPALRVVAGTITRDGINYQPWLTVQDSSGYTKDSRDIGFAEYQWPQGNNLSSVFGTGSIAVGGPKLSQSSANAWFDGQNAKNAQLILESLSYQ